MPRKGKRTAEQMVEEQRAREEAARQAEEAKKRQQKQSPAADQRRRRPPTEDRLSLKERAQRLLEEERERRQREFRAAVDELGGAEEAHELIENEPGKRAEIARKDLLARIDKAQRTILAIQIENKDEEGYQRELDELNEMPEAALRQSGQWDRKLELEAGLEDLRKRKATYGPKEQKGSKGKIDPLTEEQKRTEAAEELRRAREEAQEELPVVIHEIEAWEGSLKDIDPGDYPKRAKDELTRLRQLRTKYEKTLGIGAKKEVKPAPEDPRERARRQALEEAKRKVQETERKLQEEVLPALAGKLAAQEAVRKVPANIAEIQRLDREMRRLFTELGFVVPDLANAEDIVAVDAQIDRVLTPRKKALLEIAEVDRTVAQNRELADLIRREDALWEGIGIVRADETPGEPQKPTKDDARREAASMIENRVREAGEAMDALNTRIFPSLLEFYNRPDAERALAKGHIDRFERMAREEMRKAGLIVTEGASIAEIARRDQEIDVGMGAELATLRAKAARTRSDDLRITELERQISEAWASVGVRRDDGKEVTMDREKTPEERAMEDIDKAKRAVHDARVRLDENRRHLALLNRPGVLATPHLRKERERLERQIKDDEDLLAVAEGTVIDFTVGDELGAPEPGSLEYLEAQQEEMRKLEEERTTKRGLLRFLREASKTPDVIRQVKEAERRISEIDRIFADAERAEEEARDSAFEESLQWYEPGEQARMRAEREAEKKRVVRERVRQEAAERAAMVRGQLEYFEGLPPDEVSTDMRVTMAELHAELREQERIRDSRDQEGGEVEPSPAARRWFGLFTPFVQAARRLGVEEEVFMRRRQAIEEANVEMGNFEEEYTRRAISVIREVERIMTRELSDAQRKQIEEAVHRTVPNLGALDHHERMRRFFEAWAGNDERTGEPLIRPRGILDRWGWNEKALQRLRQLAEDPELLNEREAYRWRWERMRGYEREQNEALTAFVQHIDEANIRLPAAPAGFRGWTERDVILYARHIGHMLRDLGGTHPAISDERRQKLQGFLTAVGNAHQALLRYRGGIMEGVVDQALREPVIRSAEVVDEDEIV